MESILKDETKDKVTNAYNAFKRNTIIPAAILTTAGLAALLHGFYTMKSFPLEQSPEYMRYRTLSGQIEAPAPQYSGPEQRVEYLTSIRRQIDETIEMLGSPDLREEIREKEKAAKRIQSDTLKGALASLLGFCAVGWATTPRIRIKRKSEAKTAKG